MSENVYSATYPVGSIYISVNSTNPGTLFPGTTWVSFGAGKTLVGVDTSDSDFNTVQKTGGAKTVTLSISQMPSHNHTSPTGTDGFMSHVSSEAAGLSHVTLAKGTQGEWAHYSQTVNTGGGGAHNNLQPYITVYMWRRTA